MTVTTKAQTASATPIRISMITPGFGEGWDVQPARWATRSSAQESRHDEYTANGVTLRVYCAAMSACVAQFVAAAEMCWCSPCGNPRSEQICAACVRFLTNQEPSAN
jgi:hypothetical protein